jgi:hypothetical protein
MLLLQAQTCIIPDSGQRLSFSLRSSAFDQNLGGHRRTPGPPRPNGLLEEQAAGTAGRREKPLLLVFYEYTGFAR